MGIAHEKESCGKLWQRQHRSPFCPNSHGNPRLRKSSCKVGTCAERRTSSSGSNASGMPTIVIDEFTGFYGSIDSRQKLSSMRNRTLFGPKNYGRHLLYTPDTPLPPHHPHRFPSTRMSPPMATAYSQQYKVQVEDAGLSRINTATTCSAVATPADVSAYWGLPHWDLAHWGLALWVYPREATCGNRPRRRRHPDSQKRYIS
jgi:hypothetical protein